MLKITAAKVLRVAVTFGFFQGGMALLGWFLGRSVVDFVSAFDHWIAFGLLALIGGKMLYESFQKDDDEKDTDISKGMLLITLAVATSIDALAVGLSFAVLETNILFAASVIGIASFIASIIGFYVGKRAGNIIGKRAEAIGGLVLIGIGIKILIEHLSG